MNITVQYKFTARNIYMSVIFPKKILVHFSNLFSKFSYSVTYYKIVSYIMWIFPLKMVFYLR